MDTALRVMVEAAAQLVLEQYRQTHPTWIDDKTPIDDIAQWLGLEVTTFHSADYPIGTYGFTDADEDENLIWLCRDLPETFHRFTLAHEIGHALLHCQSGQRLLDLSPHFHELISRQNSRSVLPEPSREDPCNQDDVQADLSDNQADRYVQEKLGIGHTYNPRSERELAANRFAAALLLPAQRLRTLYQDMAVPANTLHTRFGVSAAALLNRLMNVLTEELAEPATPPTIEPATIMPPINNAPKAFDEFQQAAIEATTPALIVAGPGSGKTSTLIGRITHLINTMNVPPHHILALTFSRKATQEMEDRLLQLLADKKHALPRVSTFHAFCADLLRQHGHLVGLRPDFALIDDAEGYMILRQQANNLRLRHLQLLHAPTYYFPDILKAISRAKDELISPEEYLLLAQRMQEQASSEEETFERVGKTLEVAQIYARYQTELQRRGDTDFGGLLTLAIQLLRTHPDILKGQQQTYQHILVDEFQDVNRASSVLLQVLAGEERNVWVVGDANQAIYGFRGASPANISRFTHDFPGATTLPLSRNYRSRPDLVTIAEAFRCHQLERGEKPGKNQPTRTNDDDAYVTIAQAPDEASEMAGLIEDIKQKRQQGYAYKDMMVLCRTRAQVQKISRALATADFPIKEETGLLEQEHIKNVLSILLLLIRKDGVGLLRAARQPDHALSQSDIELILLAARNPDTTVRQLFIDDNPPLNMSIEGRHTFHHLSEILQSLLAASDVWSLLTQYLLLETSLIRSLLRSRELEKNKLQLVSYQQLLNIARHYDQLQKISTQQDSTSAKQISETPLSEQIAGFLDYLNLLVLLRQDTGNRQNNEEQQDEQTDILRVMTVHASKGLEFPIVYLPGLTQRRFPSQFRSETLPLPVGVLQYVDENEHDRHENQESCLFYVGVTRARDHIILSYSERYGKLKQKPSFYLDPLKEELPTKRIQQLYWSQQYVSTVLTQMQETDEAALLSQPDRSFIQAMQNPIITAQAIESYQRCPRRYAYTYIYHFNGDEDGYLIFIKSTQKTIQVLNRLREQQEPIDTEEIHALYNQHWQELGGQEAHFSSLYEEHGHDVIESLHRQLSMQEQPNWNIRPSYDIDIVGTKVHVTIDRVEQSDATEEPARFIRTRMGKRKSKPEADTRELLYTLAYRQHHPGQAEEVHSHNLSTGEIAPITMTSRKESSLYEKATQAIKGIEQHDYPAQPAEPSRCPSCPFFFICPS
ncbi:MAG TPA: UvrD-helicase domain-containing protein [Dictyobacter sp.]|nr:UvrD-helicase domain-containing protein [Dictyobacter sp.]